MSVEPAGAHMDRLAREGVHDSACKRNGCNGRGLCMATHRWHARTQHDSDLRGAYCSGVRMAANMFGGECTATCGMDVLGGSGERHAQDQLVEVRGA
ncbi:hypothetical protein AMTR_s00008p00251610 [Amborella trichopoda]|uniref:Uncharacterized protein n=1 Tax=Amborella trichopoda TaxID=13333 RepID=W1NI25_AMBTC|nr:hypothetical protein AMTR_s00008p00251610 [Amborella trichopoda]